MMVTSCQRYPQQHPQMTDFASPTWHAMVARATTLGEILALAEDLVERVDPVELASLPASCRPRHMQTAADLSNYAYDLKRCACEYRGPAEETLGRLAMFFSDAAVR